MCTKGAHGKLLQRTTGTNPLSIAQSLGYFTA